MGDMGYALADFKLQWNKREEKNQKNPKEHNFAM